MSAVVPAYTASHTTRPTAYLLHASRQPARVLEGRRRFRPRCLSSELPGREQGRRRHMLRQWALQLALKPASCGNAKAAASVRQVDSVAELRPRRPV